MSAASSVTAGSSPQPPPAKSRRRWFQFSLRSLSIFMVVCSVLLGAFGWRLQRAKRQAQTVAALRDLGCRLVEYDYYFERTKGGGFARAQKQETRIPAILIQWLGEDFFHDIHTVCSNSDQPKSPQEVQQFWKLVATLPEMRVFEVERGWLDHEGFAALRGNQTLQKVLFLFNHVTDADLAVAGTMPDLRMIDIFGSSPVATYDDITDDGIAALDGLGELQHFTLSLANSRGMSSGGIGDEAARHLAKHPKLEALSLSGDHLTDESTVWLGKMTQLRQLSISSADIGDEGLRNLKPLTKLTSLSVEGTKITDEGLAHLAGLTELCGLNFRGTKVHGPGLVYLRNLPKLVAINITGNLITDEDLQYFAHLPMLETLQLGDSQVTDEGICNLKISGKITAIHLQSTKITDRSLRVLAAHKQLTRVLVFNTGVTPAGVAQFKAALPACNISP